MFGVSSLLCHSQSITIPSVHRILFCYGEWSASHPCRFTPDERASVTNLIRGSVDSGAVLDNMEMLKFLILPGLELRDYRLHYRCSWGTRTRKSLHTTDVRVLGYRSGGPGSIPGTTRFSGKKKKLVGLELGPLSLVSTT
jgi:hypothetical protein